MKGFEKLINLRVRWWQAIQKFTGYIIRMVTDRQERAFWKLCLLLPSSSPSDCCTSLKLIDWLICSLFVYISLHIHWFNDWLIQFVAPAWHKLIDLFIHCFLSIHVHWFIDWLILLQVVAPAWYWLIYLSIVCLFIYPLIYLLIDSPSDCCTSLTLIDLFIHCFF